MDTREKLKTILHEWSEFVLPKAYERDFDARLLEGGEVLSIIGPRRAGKTYVCYQLMRQLKDTVPAANMIYINFEDERLYPLKGDELTLLWDICREVFDIDEEKRVYLFVDEIQNINNWSKWARRITEQNKGLKLIITGSSSKLLSKEIATELRGRTVSAKVFPLSFREYLRARGFKTEFGEALLYGRQGPAIKRHFNEYARIGGFPAVIDAANKAEILKEYFGVMFYRDMVERHKIENVRLMEDFLTLAVDQMACSFSVSATAKKLIEFGHSFSKNTIANFLRYAQDAFLIFEVKRYSYKIREQLRAPRKIYAIDHGLVQAVRFASQENTGRVLENIVYMQLIRSGRDVHYHKDGKECDFIVSDDGRVRRALQVTRTMRDARTKERELKGIEEAMTKYKLKEGLILTEDEHGEVKIGAGKVTIEPVWYWLMRKKNGKA